MWSVEYMQRVSLEIYTSALEAAKIITDVVDHKVELSIPAGSVLLDNILNLKIILEQAKKVGKEVDFVTEDEFGKNLLNMLRGERDEIVVGESMIDSKSRVKFPAVHLPSLHFFASGINLKKLGLVIPLVILLAGVFGFLFLSQQHKAKVILYFTPQVLTKSVGIKVGDGLKTDLDKKVLAGLKLAGSVDYSLTATSTGIELEGEKAKGKVTLYNSSSVLEAIVLKKGTRLTYKNKDSSYVFTTQNEVIVPVRTGTVPNITSGTAEVLVTAEAIGSVYNIKKDRELSVKDYKSSDLVASSAEDFKGGFSKEIKVVTQEDLTKLEQDLTANVLKTPADALKNRIPAGYALIDKSEKVASKTVVLNNKVGDKKDPLSGSITAQVEGLAYSKTELVDFMGKISKNVVPQGFEFYSYNKELQVDVLGNTEKTVLSPTEADLQVTFKFNIAPKIDEQKVFEKIAGLSVVDAIAKLDKISDVTKAELKIEPGFLFFRKVPTKASAVDIQIKIEE